MLSLLGLPSEKSVASVRQNVEKMESISKGKNTNSDQRMGNLSKNKDVGEQLQELKGKMERTMTKSKGEIKNYRELTKFNEQLAKSYSANLKVIVEVSKLLGAYNEFFDLFKEKLAEIDRNYL